MVVGRVRGARARHRRPRRGPRHRPVVRCRHLVGAVDALAVRLRPDPAVRLAPRHTARATPPRRSRPARRAAHRRRARRRGRRVRGPGSADDRHRAGRWRPPLNRFARGRLVPAGVDAVGDLAQRPASRTDRRRVVATRRRRPADHHRLAARPCTARHRHARLHRWLVERAVLGRRRAQRTDRRTERPQHPRRVADRLRPPLRSRRARRRLPRRRLRRRASTRRPRRARAPHRARAAAGRGGSSGSPASSPTTARRGCSRRSPSPDRGSTIRTGRR